MKRIGEPGGTLTFSYLVSDHDEEEFIVYANDMIGAILKFKLETGNEPYLIRQMSDGE